MSLKTVARRDTAATPAPKKTKSLCLCTLRLKIEMSGKKAFQKKELCNQLTDGERTESNAKNVKTSNNNNNDATVFSHWCQFALIKDGLFTAAAACAI